MVGPVMGACSCHCERTPASTIKGISTVNGLTQWVYGPGSWWRHHHGLDRISGLVPNLAASLNKYVLVPGDLAGNRPLTANAAEAITITKLNSLTGAVVESATLEAFFCSAFSATYFTLIGNTFIRNAVGLSGGDYVVVAHRAPVIEFSGYTSNTANKTYYLHSHTQREGNVTLTTKTSSESIVIPWDSTAAAIKTLFEATADCTAATVTGGPWPLLKVQVDATWSVAGGDISRITPDSTYMVPATGTGTCDYVYNIPPGAWTLIDDSCTTGTATEPTTPGFNLENRAGTCNLGTGTTRSVDGVAASYSTSTGLMLSAVGCEFGRDVSVTPTKLMAKAGSIPSWTAAAVLGINEIAAAATNRVVVNTVGTGGTSGAGATLEAWTVANPWTRAWQLHCNTGGVSNLHIQSNTAIVSFPRAAFTGGNRVAATINAASAAVVEYDASFVSTNIAYRDNLAASWLSDGSTTEMTITDYERTDTDTEYPNNVFKYHFVGGEIAVNGNEMLLGGPTAALGSVKTGGVGGGPNFIGTDATQTYASCRHVSSPTVNANYPPRNPVPSAFSSSTPYYWQFFLPLNVRLATGTQWRFKFTHTTLGNKYSSWLDWYCTAAQIKTAILVAFPENTEGAGISNAQVYPFGEPSTIINPDFAPLQEGLDVIFNGATNAAGISWGFPLRSYFQYGQIAIEFQTVTAANANGFGAWTRTTTAVVWQRTFGVAVGSGSTVVSPSYAWLRGAWIYAVGPLVVAE